MLLGADYHSRAHEAHVGNDLVRGEGMLVDEIRSDEAPRSSESGFAVNGNTLLLHSDHVVCQVDKLPDKCKRRACTVIEDHVKMLDAELCEVCGGVKFRVQAYDEADIP